MKKVMTFSGKGKELKILQSRLPMISQELGKKEKEKE